jgi:hypothetical protein
MEAVEIDSRLFQELEEDTDALLGVLDRVGTIIPRHLSGSPAEWIGQRIAHDMPVGGRKPEVIAHWAPLDQFLGVVVFESQGIPGLRTFVLDDRNIGEVAHGFLTENLLFVISDLL